MNKDLDNYISGQLAQGIHTDAIKQSLLAAGWKEEDIDVALQNAAPSTMNKDAAVRSVTAHTAVDHPHSEHPAAAKPSSSGSGGHRRRFVLIGVIGVAVILILAGAGFAYAYYTSPAYAFSAMRNKMATVKIFTYNGTLSGNMIFANVSDVSTGNTSSTPKTTNTPLNLTFNGSADISQPSSPSVSLSMQSGSFGLQVLAVGSDGYFRISGVPLSSQWIQVNQTALNSQQSSAVAQLNHTLTPAEQLAVQTDLTTLYGQIYGSDVKQMPDDTISGQAMHHYQITLDKWTAARLADDLAEQQSGKSLNILQYLGDSALLGGIQNITADVWIGKQDMFVHRMMYTILLADTYPLAGGTIKLDLTLDNFNKSVAITPPTSSVNLQNVANSLLPLLMGSGLSSSSIGRSNNTPSGMGSSFSSSFATPAGTATP